MRLVHGGQSYSFELLGPQLVGSGMVWGGLGGVTLLEEVSKANTRARLSYLPADFGSGCRAPSYCSSTTSAFAAMPPPP